jgi:hypothetical protein
MTPTFPPAARQPQVLGRMIAKALAECKGDFVASPLPQR